MNQHEQSDLVLDQLIRNEIDNTEAKSRLTKIGITDIEAEIDLHEVAVKTIQQFATMQQVRAIHNQYVKGEISTAAVHEKNNTNQAKIRPFAMFMRIAALLLVSGSIWLAYQYQHLNSNRLYHEISQAYLAPTDRNLSHPETHHMVQEFKAGEYQKVIKIYESLAFKDNREIFLASYSYLQINQAGPAINGFQSILQQNTHNNTRLYNDEAEFFLGLAYLSNHDFQKAHSLLKKITENPNHTYQGSISKWQLFKMKWL